MNAPASPPARDHILRAILAILLLSAIPVVIEYVRHRRHQGDKDPSDDTKSAPEGSAAG